jgi:mannan endo-1,4-beta-mannosidase
VTKAVVTGVLSAACAAALIAVPSLMRWSTAGGSRARPAAEAGSGGTGPCQERRLPARPYLGVVPGGFPARTSGLASFAAAAAAEPQLVAFYTRFGAPFQASAVCQVIRHGAVPIIQIQPQTASVAAIAAGRYDRYLTRYAKAVRAVRGTVALSFGHEMNGYWYDWGYRDVPPATFIRAWRVIHAVFASAGARNVIWLWTVNKNGRDVLPARDYWPGPAYVTWVGVDGYLRTSRATFAKIFEHTITDIRKFTSKPILIAETAVAPGPAQAQQIVSLFTAVKSRPDLLGLVWFDIDAKSKWQIEGNPAASAALRAALPGYLPHTGQR